MSDRFYMLYDGRAVYDVEAACVMETIGECSSDNNAIKNANKNWKGYDCVLVSYEVDSADNTTLIDEHVIGHLRDLV